MNLNFDEKFNLIRRLYTTKIELLDKINSDPSLAKAEREAVAKILDVVVLETSKRIIAEEITEAASGMVSDVWVQLSHAFQHSPVFATSCLVGSEHVATESSVRSKRVTNRRVEAKLRKLWDRRTEAETRCFGADRS